MFQSQGRADEREVIRLDLGKGRLEVQLQGRAQGPGFHPQDPQKQTQITLGKDGGLEEETLGPACFRPQDSSCRADLCLW